MKPTLDAYGVSDMRSRVAAGSSLAQPMQILQSPVAAEEASDATEAPVWKRVLDLACILLALPAALFVTVVIATFIKTVSPGPVFFKQERVGHRRTRFRCWKFRTMRADADTARHQQHVKTLLQSDVPLTKLDAAGDPRLIPCGAMLRASGLDELPQLINVWRGEMSLVGPRPCMPYEEENYRPWQLARFNTLPGLTGLWQISGKNETTFTEMVALDILYVRNKSLWLDLKIMTGTVSVLVSQVREVAGRTRSQDDSQLLKAL
jgi:lipopolysaccharide/colanic/teichoic acid biosynthesis glycosyltransferase